MQSSDWFNLSQKCDYYLDNVINDKMYRHCPVLTTFREHTPSEMSSDVRNVFLRQTRMLHSVKTRHLIKLIISIITPYRTRRKV
jgi:hypothetical protein